MAHTESAHRPVREVMTNLIAAVGPDATAGEIAQRMRDDNVGSVLVTERNRLMGVISDRQLALRCLTHVGDAKTVTASEIMTPDPITVGPDTSEEEALRIIGEHRVRRLPVVEGDTVIGIVSVADLAKDLENCRECLANLASELSKAA